MAQILGQKSPFGGLCNCVQQKRGHAIDYEVLIISVLYHLMSIFTQENIVYNDDWKKSINSTSSISVESSNCPT